MSATAALLCPAIKTAIRLHYKERCQYCGADGANQVEHIVPLARGGANTLGNATLACGPCNARKQAIELDSMFVAIAHAAQAPRAPITPVLEITS